MSPLKTFYLGFFKFFPRRLTLAHVLGPIISQVTIFITRPSIIKIPIADSESKLLNEINLKHTDCSYGKEAFTSKDLVVRLKDAKEFHKFLDLCHKKLVLKKSNASDRCGFFRYEAFDCTDTGYRNTCVTIIQDQR